MSERRNPREAGSSIIEAMIALTIGAIALAIAFAQLLDAHRSHFTQSQVTEMRQNARNLVEIMSRELLPAAFGMLDAPLDVSTPIANVPTLSTTFSDDAITVRLLMTDVRSALTSDMSSVTSDIDLGSSTGLTVGARTIIWDGADAWDWVNVSAISSSTRIKHSNAFSKVYLASEDATIAVVKEISYRYLEADRVVQRMEDGGEWATVANNVVAFTLHYFDDGGAEIFPADAPTRSMIRRVGIELTVRTADTDRLSHLYRTYHIETSVTLRNLASVG